jgi:hypothetical protein
MGHPLVCTECTCATKNGLLAEECRRCGAAISRSGFISRVRVPGGAIPSAAWETPSIPDLWRQTAPLTVGPPEILDAHDFFRYVLLLRAMKERFEQEDEVVWFDDALFFLRGGYDFFCNLNLSSAMTLRGRIFGGLNHARGPAQALVRWLDRFVAEARARSVGGVDVFVAEEINSGSGAHRIMNVIRDALPALPAGAALTIDFWFSLACTDDTVFDICRFTTEIATKRRLEDRNVTVRNNFRLFQGPLLAYDAERYSGLRVLSAGADQTERYACVRQRLPTFHLRCPATSDEPFWCAPGENDLDNLVGVLALRVLAAKDSVPRTIMTSRLSSQSCSECKSLFAEVRAPMARWCDRLL